MGKGSSKRPSSISRADFEAKWAAAFGPREREFPTIMPEEDRRNDEMAKAWEDEDWVPVSVDGPEEELERDPYWNGPGYRGEYSCPCGVGHGNHVHGCCGKHCCTRDDFPLRRRPNDDER